MGELLVKSFSWFRVMIMTMMIDDYGDLDNNCDGVARLQIIRCVIFRSKLAAAAE